MVTQQCTYVAIYVAQLDEKNMNSHPLAAAHDPISLLVYPNATKQTNKQTNKHVTLLRSILV